MTTHVLGAGLPAETAPEGFTYLTIMSAAFGAGSYARNYAANASIIMCREYFIEDFNVTEPKNLVATTWLIPDTSCHWDDRGMHVDDEPDATLTYYRVVSTPEGWNLDDRFHKSA